MINNLVLKLFEDDYGFDSGQAETGYSTRTDAPMAPIKYKKTKNPEKLIASLKKKGNQSPLKINLHRSVGQNYSSV